MAEVKITVTAEDGSQRVFRAIEEGSTSAFAAVDKGAAEAESSVKGFSHACEIAGSRTWDFVKSLGLYDVIRGFSGALRDLAQSTLETAASFEKSEILFTRLTGSAAQGRQAFDWLFDLKAPMGIEALQDSFVKLQTAGLDPMAGKLQVLVDSIAAFGGGTSELQRASVAIQQMAGKGVISMEELRQQLGEALPTAMKIMARELGMSMSELSDAVGSGALDAKTGLDALFKGLEKDYAGAAAEMMNSWGGFVTQLEKEWKRLQKALMDAGVFETLKGVLKEVSDGISNALKTGEVERWASALTSAVKTTVAALDIFVKVTAFAADNVDALAVALTALAVTKAMATISTMTFSFTALAAAITAAKVAAMSFLPVLAAVLAYEGSMALYNAFSQSKREAQAVKTILADVAEEQEFLNKRAERYKKTVNETAAETARYAQATKEMIDDSIKGLQALSGAITKIGASDLKFAGETFTKALGGRKSEMSGMKNALEEYLRTVDVVYDRQRRMQATVAGGLHFSGAGPADIARQQAAILETEQSLAGARLQAWSQYYTALKTLHGQATDEMKKKSQELQTLETAIIQQRQGYLDLDLGLRQKLMTETERYYSTQRDLEMKLQQALALSGEAKIKGLTDWQRAAANAVREVKEGDLLVVSLQDAVSTALGQVRDAQVAIEQEQEALTAAKRAEIEVTKSWIASLEQAMTKATEMIGLYKDELRLLDVDLAQQRVLSIDTSGAIASVRMLKAEILSAIALQQAAGAAVSGGTIITTTTTSEGPLYTNVPVDSFSPHGGSSYIPKTGPYWLLQGERVQTPREAAADRRQVSVSLHFRDIVLPEAKGGRQAAKEFQEQLADDIRRGTSPIVEELKKKLRLN